MSLTFEPYSQKSYVVRGELVQNAEDRKKIYDQLVGAKIWNKKLKNGGEGLIVSINKTNEEVLRKYVKKDTPVLEFESDSPTERVEKVDIPIVTETSNNIVLSSSNVVVPAITPTLSSTAIVVPTVSPIANETSRVKPEILDFTTNSSNSLSPLASTTNEEDVRNSKKLRSHGQKSKEELKVQTDSESETESDKNKSDKSDESSDDDVRSSSRNRKRRDDTKDRREEDTRKEVRLSRARRDEDERKVRGSRDIRDVYGSRSSRDREIRNSPRNREESFKKSPKKQLIESESDTSVTDMSEVETVVRSPRNRRPVDSRVASRTSPKKNGESKHSDRKPRDVRRSSRRYESESETDFSASDSTDSYSESSLSSSSDSDLRRNRKRSNVSKSHTSPRRGHSFRESSDDSRSGSRVVTKRKSNEKRPVRSRTPFSSSDEDSSSEDERIQYTIRRQNRVRGDEPKTEVTDEVLSDQEDVVTLARRVRNLTRRLAELELKKVVA